MCGASKVNAFISTDSNLGIFKKKKTISFINVPLKSLKFQKIQFLFSVAIANYKCFSMLFWLFLLFSSLWFSRYSRKLDHLPTFVQILFPDPLLLKSEFQGPPRGTLRPLKS